MEKEEYHHIDKDEVFDLIRQNSPLYNPKIRTPNGDKVVFKHYLQCSPSLSSVPSRWATRGDGFHLREGNIRVEISASECRDILKELTPQHLDKLSLKSCRFLEKLDKFELVFDESVAKKKRKRKRCDIIMLSSILTLVSILILVTVL